jgi:peptide-methionine (S)-S-oxide reductase
MTRDSCFVTNLRRARHASIRMFLAATLLVLLPSLRVGAADSNLEAKAGDALQSAVLAGGCFWGMQAVFEHLKGVRRVLAGYSGGKAATAHYLVVSTGATGHAESVEITFDPREVSYGQILQVFFSVAHDPTELNRQGPDDGSQYRSAIFYADPTQRRIALTYIAQLERTRVFAQPIVTRVDPLAGFYPAEGYHQDYLLHNLSDPYIVYNDLPKLARFRALLPQLYREQPALVAAAPPR